MAFGEKVRECILRNVGKLGIGCGIGLILMGVYILIIASNAGRGLSFIQARAMSYWV